MKNTCIVFNGIRCKRCQNVVYSRHRHDYQVCRCGAVAVDGGLAYLRRGGAPCAAEELSLMLPEEIWKGVQNKASTAFASGYSSPAMVVVEALRYLRENGYTLRGNDDKA